MEINVNNLVVFGDSYSDVGNFHRWANGPVWSENVAVGWNAALYSLAYTGAACDNALFPNVSDLMPSLRDQIEMFYNLGLNMDPEDTVFAVWVGMNDIKKTYEQQGLGEQADFTKVASCITQQIRNLRRVFRAKRIIVFNVPPLERMPFFADNDDEPTKEKWGMAAREVNRLLQRSVTSLNKHHHALELDLVDVHSLLNDILDNPKVFGFVNAVSPYLDDNTCCRRNNNIDEYVWWDRTHWTGGVHRVIANSILIAGSYEGSTLVDSKLTNVQALIDQPNSRFRSPIYISPPNTGLIDRLAEEISSRMAVQEDLRAQETPYHASNLYLTLTIVLIIAVLVWVHRRRGRGRRLRGLLEADEPLLRNRTRVSPRDD